MQTLCEEAGVEFDPNLSLAGNAGGTRPEAWRFGPDARGEVKDGELPEARAAAPRAAH